MSYKCKACGNDLAAMQGAKAVFCQFCGMGQTLPAVIDDRKTQLFNAANDCRLQKRYDEAEALYKTLKMEYPDESEARWGLLLCIYGVEYTDGSQGRKTPVCHRAVATPIMQHPEYLMILARSSREQNRFYSADAIEIDRQQKTMKTDDFAPRFMSTVSDPDPDTCTVPLPRSPTCSDLRARNEPPVISSKPTDEPSFAGMLFCASGRFRVSMSTPPTKTMFP